MTVLKYTLLKISWRTNILEALSLIISTECGIKNGKLNLATPKKDNPP
jgi:hypothetical protein